MSQTDDTIEQLRFLAENWHRFSNWTRLQIIVTIWWFVKIRRPLRRIAKRLGLPARQLKMLAWLIVMLLFSLSFFGLAATGAWISPQFSLFLALISAVFLGGLMLIQNRSG